MNNSIDLTATPLAARYRDVRARTMALCRTLSAEDCQVQSMPSVSPAKWHLAHTTWFFERFILREHVRGYQPLDAQYDYLFNSYYYTVGQMHPRSRRGLLTRPSLEQVITYREHVDEHMTSLFDRAAPAALPALLEVGLNHEQQHQELMLTDIKHVFYSNPLRPAVMESRGEHDGAGASATPHEHQPQHRNAWHRYPEGIHEIGHAGDRFCFDNETPRHQVLLGRWELAARLVTNGDYLAFMRDGGYERSELWLADGWVMVQSGEIRAPMYWNEELDGCFTLAGTQPLHSGEPVCHVSYFEADAFARWAGCRLPSEAEWEVAARGVDLSGNLLDSGHWHPREPAGNGNAGPAQMFGDVWEWTASPYVPYPRYQPLDGALGEYNGKFMCNQIVCRGGSCVTPAGHVRPSYRNFFYPHERWQFFGIRLARDS